MTEQKIALATDDGERLSNNFGHAPHAVIITLDKGQITARELRDKGHSPHHHDHDDGHIPEPGSKFAAVADCDVIIARGVGSPGYAYAQEHGFTMLLVKEKTIDEAIQAYLDGTLAHDPRRVHAH